MQFWAKFLHLYVFGHASPESDIHFETESSITGVSVHAQCKDHENTLEVPLWG